MKAAAELQKAILAALLDNGELVDRLGGAKVFDHAPAAVAFPYVTFGRTNVADWSTATEAGHEHLFTLHVWSKAKGKAETLAVMEMVRLELHDAELVLDGSVLVNLRCGHADVRYDDDHSVYHGLLRFRAVTEEAG